MHNPLFLHLYNMKLFLVTTLIILTASACGVNRDYPCDEILSPNPIVIAGSSISTDSIARIKGKVFDEYGEPLFGTTIFLEGSKMGALVDMNGKFEINNIPPGTYKLKVRMAGYATVMYENLVLEAGSEVVFQDIILINEVLELKPIIYFYPTDTINLSVHLDYDGDIIHTYPESDGHWELTAYPNGTLIDSTRRSFYSVYWEGITTVQKTINSGFIVKQTETISFLEDKLDQLGLSEREANEFIIFWLPILNQNEANLIHFDTEHYTKHAILNIDPKPETLIRIMMLYSPIETGFQIPQQIIPPKAERKGFTVVEWGGHKISLSQIELQ